MVPNAALLTTQHFKRLIKDKVEQSREGVAPFPNPVEVANEKGVTLNYNHQLY